MKRTIKGRGTRTFRKIAKKGRKQRAAVGGGKGLPTLSDFTKKVPRGGLLNPGLRKGYSVTKISALRKPKGKFGNIGL